MIRHLAFFLKALPLPDSLNEQYHEYYFYQNY